MTGPKHTTTNHPAAAASPDESLDEAALDQVAGGRMAGDSQSFEVFHPHQPLSWSVALTDPALSVPHAPTLGEAIARAQGQAAGQDRPHDDPKPEAKPTVFANW